MATGPSSDEGKFPDTMNFSAADKSGDDSDSSSSFTSTADGEGEDYSNLGQFMESVSATQDAVAVIGAEKKQLSKKMRKFGVKKLKYESVMETLAKMANNLTEQEKILKEQRDVLNLLKAARLSESQKKVTELDCEISRLKGKIEEVKLESKKYNESHKALIEEMSNSSIPDEPHVP